MGHIPHGRFPASFSFLNMLGKPILHERRGRLGVACPRAMRQAAASVIFLRESRYAPEHH
jgi:hypothetical protein